jgi:uncharacterized protein (TIGR02391 family)
MSSRRSQEPPPPDPKIFREPSEVDRGIQKLERRIAELSQLDVRQAITGYSGEDDVIRSNVREAILDIFGPTSPEFQEHQHVQIWSGPMRMGMDQEDVIEGTERGKTQVTAILRGLVARLKERWEDLVGGGARQPSMYLRDLNLHPRIADVATDRFLDGYEWDAVFAAAKALVNYVKERSGKDDLDGAALMRAVFPKNSPLLAFNALTDQTELDEQEGTMHLFEGAVLAIRNPGGHSFPEGSAQRALEYINFLSLLAYRVQEAKRRR